MKLVLNLGLAALALGLVLAVAMPRNAPAPSAPAPPALVSQVQALAPGCRLTQQQLAQAAAVLVNGNIDVDALRRIAPSCQGPPGPRRP